MKQSIVNKMKRNECVIQAIVGAVGASYEDAYSFIEGIVKRGGKHLKMSELSKRFNVKAFELGEKQEDGTKKLIQRYRMNRQWKEGGYTVVSFIKKFSEGSYIIFVRDKAFAIADGKIQGDGDSSKRSRVLQAFKIEK